MADGELILFGDIEAAAVAALEAGLAVPRSGVAAWTRSVPVGTRVPEGRPTRFLRLFRAGGPSETLISENALIVLEAWAELEGDAVLLLNLGRAILFNQDGYLFGVTEVGGPANLPDPTTSQTRYTMTLGVRARATVTA